MSYLIITGLLVIILYLLMENMSTVNRMRTGLSARNLRHVLGLTVLFLLAAIFPRMREKYREYKQRIS
jgi:cytochrome b561